MNTHSPTVVVCEGNELNAKIYHDLLGAWDITNIRTSGLAIEALAFVKETSPDLLITGLRQPQHSGLELIQWVRALPPFANLPILCISAVVDDHQFTAECIKTGATRVLRKPFQLRAFFDGVRELLGEKWPGAVFQSG
jgi:CheY-like chemotaxis protein